MLFIKYNYREKKNRTIMDAIHDVLINNIHTHSSDLNPNAPVFVPRWLQPPMPVRQNGTIWGQATDMSSIIKEFPDNSKRRRIITTQYWVQHLVQ